MEPVASPGPARNAAPVVVVAVGVLSGGLLATFWSYALVDGISERIASAILGYDAREPDMLSLAMALAFAFVSGLAGTCTACNIGAFSALGPLSGASGLPSRKPIFWLLAGLIPVAVIYGAVGTLFGPAFPQLSMAWIGGREIEFPLRLVQSSILFSAVGILYVLWGLAKLGVVPNPLSGFSVRHPFAEPALMGATIGLYLVGRPFPLFLRLFEHVVSVGNPLLGSLAFVLQGLGNVLVVLIVFLVVRRAKAGSLGRRLSASPQRAGGFAAGSLLAAGTYFVIYWGIRLPARFGFGFWFRMPWD